MAVLLECRKILCNFFYVTFPELITDKQANSIREMHSIKPLHQSYIPSSPLLAHHTHTRSHLKSICNSIFHTANGIQYNIFMLTDNEVSTFLSAYLLCRAYNIYCNMNECKLQLVTWNKVIDVNSHK